MTIVSKSSKEMHASRFPSSSRLTGQIRGPRTRVPQTSKFKLQGPHDDPFARGVDDSVDLTQFIFYIPPLESLQFDIALVDRRCFVVLPFR